MKKHNLLYSVFAIVVFTLQSCVSNYAVVSQPINIQNKTNAKLTLAATQLPIVKEKKVSPSQQINAALATLEKGQRASEIQKTILHEKKIDALLVEAESYLGTPYRFGGMSRSGIDCSAFVLSVFGSAMGLELPRVAASQAQEGERVERGNLQKGDLVFFSHRGGGRISHVGIVHEVSEDGEVKFIHSSTSKGVTITSLSSSYWGPRYRFAKRVIDRDHEPNTSVYANNN